MFDHLYEVLKKRDERLDAQIRELREMVKKQSEMIEILRKILGKDPADNTPHLTIVEDFEDS